MPVRKVTAPARSKRRAKTPAAPGRVQLALDPDARILTVRPPRGLSLMFHSGARKGRLLSDLLPPAARALFGKAFKAAWRSGKERSVKFRTRRAGTTNDLVLVMTPHREEGLVFASLQAAPMHPVPSAAPATDLEKTRDILENLADAVMIVDKSMRIVLANREACRSLGYTLEELRGLYVKDIEVGFGAAGRREIGPKLVGGERITVRGIHRRKDGSTFPTEARMGSAVIGGEMMIVISARDITAQSSAERALAETLERYKLLSKNELVGVYIAEDGVFSYCNNRCARMFGYRPEDLVGKKTLTELVHPEDRPLAAKNQRLRLAGKVPYQTFRIRGLHRNGDTIHVDIFGSTVEIGGKRLLHGTIVDVTDQVREQKELLFRDNALKTSTTAIALASIAGAITYVNGAFLGMWGYRKESEVVGRPADGFWARPDLAAGIIGRLQTEGFATGELEALRKDGTRFIARMTASIVRGKDRKPLGMLGWFADVTEERKILDALRVSEAEKAAILDSMSELVAYQDLEMTVLWSNRAAEESVGAAHGGLVGRKCYEIWHGRSVRCDVCPIARARLSGRIEKDEVRSPDGRVWFITGYPVKDGKGSITSLIEVTREVTEEVRAKAALQESEERFRTIFRANPDGMMIHDIETGRIIDVSDSFVSFTGFSREEALGRTVMDLGLEDDPGQRRHLMEMLRPGGEVRNIEMRFRRKDGAPRTGLFSGRIVTIDGVPRLLATVRDITAIKEAETALRESEERFRAVFDTSPDGFLIVELPSQTIVDVNGGFAAMTGFAKDEMVGKTTAEMGLWKNAQEREGLYATLAREERISSLEMEFITKDGSVKNALLWGIPVTLRGRRHLLGIAHDVTMIKVAENRLRSSLEEKEVLLKEIHHRVKNNLQVVSGLLNLQAHHITDPEMRTIFRESQNRLITMALIHQELYQADDLAHLDFSHYIMSVVNNLLVSYGAAPDRIGLELSIESVKMAVDTAIPVGLIITELVSNALKHAFPGGRKGGIRIAMNTRGPAEYRLRIEDDGVGLPEGFEIKSAKSLGLRIVCMICDQLGGSITLGSGAGAAFTVDFREYHEAGTHLH